ncbi:hypothetical protein ACHAXT_005424 [Thalassiosira profunda]
MGPPSAAASAARRRPPKRRPRHAVVMVLGDVGRSPRMQYHALSLLEEGHFVTLVGYAGEALVPPLQKYDQSEEGPPYRGKLHVLRMAPYQPPRKNMLHRLVYYPLRLLSLVYCVTGTLWIKLPRVPHTTLPVDVVLVQNPPSVPTLLLAYLYCVWQRIRRGHRPRLVVDWHNLGYTMFEPPDPQSSGVRAFAQRTIRALAKWHEGKMAPLADAHLTVTLAMKDWLAEHFGVRGERVRVLYDKPPLMFRPTSVEEQHELFCRLQLGAHRLNKSSSDREDETGFIERTAFTQCIRKGDASTVQLRSDRPALLVSSTSWTPDEDFSILLEALEDLHQKIDTTYDDGRFPKVMVIVTGKGPQKEHYRPYLEQFNEAHPCINIQTLWLEAGDYPTLLGCATLGISLHTSTSGLDLPMKVLDMFGCQVPVCAIGFDCLGELVEDGVNGRIFENGAELADQLFEMLAGYPGDVATDRLEKYRRNIRGMTRWKENWEKCARHLIVGDWDGDVDDE